MKKDTHFKITNITFLISLALKNSPGFFALEALSGILMGIFTSADVIFAKYFFEALDQKKDISYVLILLFIMITVAFAHQLWFQTYRNCVRPIYHQTLQTRLNCSFFEHARNLDLSYYENSEFYNNFLWAMSQSDIQISTLLQMISNIFTMIVSIIITTSIMISVSHLLLIVAVITSLFTVVLQRLNSKNNYLFNRELNPITRKQKYYERLFHTSEYSKELRMSKIANVLNDNYTDTLLQERKVTEEYNIKGNRFRIPLKLSSKLMQPFIYICLLLNAMWNGDNAILGIAVTYTAFWNLRGRIQAVMDLMVRVGEMSLYADKIRGFLEMKPIIKTGNRVLDHIYEVDSEKVSFGYSMQKEVLHQVDIKAKKGQKIAIVGYNGSGKSTFIKLLTRLYQPMSGAIKYNGQTINTYEKESFKNKVGVIFQDYRLYALSISENIMCDAESSIDNIIVPKALDSVSFELESSRFKNGIHTELTKEFAEDGVNLSGGESQKIAISRLFAHNFELIVLDEPSASLDAVAEYDLMKKLDDISSDKTIIIVSHRLSTTKKADMIYMFESGTMNREAILI